MFTWQSLVFRTSTQNLNVMARKSSIFASDASKWVKTYGYSNDKSSFCCHNLLAFNVNVNQCQELPVHFLVTRKLLMVTIFVFTHNAIARLAMMNVLLVFSLWIHQLYKPFKSLVLNFLESAFLGLLIVLSMINLFWASQYFGVPKAMVLIFWWLFEILELTICNWKFQ